MARQFCYNGAHRALRRHSVHVPRAVQADPQGGGPSHTQGESSSSHTSRFILEAGAYHHE